jgi:hypothetical protein
LEHRLARQELLELLEQRARQEPQEQLVLRRLVLLVLLQQVLVEQ